MDYEKLYKEALERAKNFIENGDERERTIAESIFAGIMEESEDERIRTKLIDYFSGFYDRFATDRNHTDVHWEGLEVKKVLAWLEKQGEKKPVNRLKTSAGNWYVCDMEVMNENMTTAFHRGEVYYCPKDGYIDVNGALFEVGTLDVFRLATKEEIPQQKQEWGEQDKCMLNNVIDTLKPLSQVTHSGYAINSMISWLKSIRPQTAWKPSEEMLEALYRAIPENVIEISEDEMLLDKLYQGLKYGRVLSKK